MNVRYAEKLKDPRWQKKRLEILQRDNWTCQACKATERTLHVHHIAYDGDEPWETDSDLLLTLCDACHEVESFEHKASVSMLLSLFAKLGIRTAFEIDMFTTAVDAQYCEEKTGDWVSAWRNGLTKYAGELRAARSAKPNR